LEIFNPNVADLIHVHFLRSDCTVAHICPTPASTLGHLLHDFSVSALTRLIITDRSTADKNPLCLPPKHTHLPDANKVHRLANSRRSLPFPISQPIDSSAPSPQTYATKHPNTLPFALPNTNPAPPRIQVEDGPQTPSATAPTCFHLDSSRPDTRRIRWQQPPAHRGVHNPACEKAKPSPTPPSHAHARGSTLPSSAATPCIRYHQTTPI
jgi:hypothetical protein